MGRPSGPSLYISTVGNTILQGRWCEARWWAFDLAALLRAGHFEAVGDTTVAVTPPTENAPGLSSRSEAEFGALAATPLRPHSLQAYEVRR